VKGVMMRPTTESPPEARAFAVRWYCSGSSSWVVSWLIAVTVP